eukprot:3865057-Prymnesium_polylepis.1
MKSVTKLGRASNGPAPPLPSPGMSGDAFGGGVCRKDSHPGCPMGRVLNRLSGDLDPRASDGPDAQAQVPRHAR